MHALVVGLAFAAWVSAPNSTFSAAQAAQEGVRLTQLAHGARLQVGEPVAVDGRVTQWTVVGGPTLLLLLTALGLFWPLRRLVRSLLADDRVPDRAALAVLGGAVLGLVATHVLIGLAAGAVGSPAGALRWVLTLLVVAVLVAGAAVLAGAPSHRLDVWFSGWPGDVGEVLQDAAVPARRVAAALLVAGLVAVLALVAAGADRVVAVHQQLSPGTLGSVVLALAQVGWLPSLAVSALGWLAGPGIVMGDSTATAGVVPDVVLPAVPLLGAVPAAGPLPAAWWAVVLVPVAVGAFLPGAVRERLAHFTEEATVLDVAWRCLAACVVVGAGLWLAGLVSTVGVSPGPLHAVGPHPLTGPAVAGELAVGAALRWGVEAALVRARSARGD